MINIDQLSEKSFICLRSDVDKLFHRDRLISSMSRFITVQAIGTQMVCFEWHTPIYSTDEQAIPDDAMRQLLNATQSRRPNARKNKGQKKKSDGQSVKQSVATAVRSVHHAEVESDGEWDQECVLAVSASAWRTNKQIWLDTGATNHVIGRNHQRFAVNVRKLDPPVEVRGFSSEVKVVTETADLELIVKSEGKAHKVRMHQALMVEDAPVSLLSAGKLINAGATFSLARTLLQSWCRGETRKAQTH